MSVNIFQLPYNQRLKHWFQLRENLINVDLQTQCAEIDKFWQYCPLVNHYLHPDFMDDWPGPWELIAENTYCPYARGLGIIYTLLLLGINNIDFVDAIDNNNEDVVLVLVDRAKYIINYWPDTIVNNCLQDFSIKKYHNLSPIITKIGST